MMADIFDQQVIVPESYESSCLGAVVLGLYATGRADSLDIVETMVGGTHEHQPVKESSDVYKALRRSLSAFRGSWKKIMKPLPNSSADSSNRKITIEGKTSIRRIFLEEADLVKILFFLRYKVGHASRFIFS